MLTIDSRNQKLIFFIIIILILIAKFSLCSVLPVQIDTSGMHDDGLMLYLGESIIESGWLGTYNSLTLIKGSFFPLFIAFVYSLGIPLLAAYTLLYFFACLSFIYAIKNIVNSKVAIIAIYTVLMFVPVTYNHDTYQRIYRDSIYFSLVLMYISFTIITYNCLKKRLVFFALPSIVSGVLLTAIWLTREEGIWLVPFLIVSVMVMIFYIRFNVTLKQKKIRILITILPFLLLVIGIFGISTINYFTYGTFLTNELKQGMFPKAYRALTSVDYGKEIPKVPITKEAMDKIALISPAFGEIKPYFDGENGRNWGNNSVAAGTVSDNSEIGVGHSLWAIRGAVESIGYYTTPDSANEYYGRLCEELEIAFNNGSLQKKEKMELPLLSSFSKKDILPFFKNLYKTINEVLCYKNFFYTRSQNSGTESSLKMAEKVTHENLDPIEQMSISGWIFSLNRGITIEVVNAFGDSKGVIKIYESPDVFEFFHSQGLNYINSKKARFSYSYGTTPNENYYLKVLTDKESYQIPLDGTVKSISNNEFILNFDSISNNIYPLEKIKLLILNKLINIYSYLNPFVFLGAIICYIFITVCLIKMIKNKYYNYFNHWLIITALGLVFLTRVLGIAYNTTTSFNSIISLYLSPCYPLMTAFSLLCLYTFYMLIKNYKKSIVKMIIGNHKMLF